MDVLPLDCMVVSKDIWIPYILKNEREVLFNETAKVTIAFGKTMFRWSVPNITNVCQDCEIGGRPCGFRSETRQAFCKKHSKFLISSCNFQLIFINRSYAMVYFLLISAWKHNGLSNTKYHLPFLSKLFQLVGAVMFVTAEYSLLQSTFADSSKMVLLFH